MSFEILVNSLSVSSIRGEGGRDGKDWRTGGRTGGRTGWRVRERREGEDQYRNVGL